MIAASTLRRSYDSAELLAPGAPRIVDVLFREVFTPTAVASGPACRQAVGGIRAAALARRMVSGCGELPRGQARARMAATALATLGEARGIVLLEAHGIMNGLIAGWLRKDGWKGPFLRARHYWA